MRRLSLLAVSISTVTLLAAGASAGTLNVNNPQLNAMGGAGASSSYQMNPALITPLRGENRFDLNLGSASFYIEDPRGFANEVRRFLDEDLEQYNNFDDSELDNALLELINTADSIRAAADDYRDEDGDTTLDELRDEAEELSPANQKAQNEVAEVTSLVTLTQENFEGFSDRPVNFGLMASLGLTMPRGGAPFAIKLENNTYGGAQFQLNDNDLQPFFNVSADINQYLGRVDVLDVRLQELIDAAEAVEENCDDQGCPNNEDDEFDDAYDRFVAAQNSLNDDTDNEVFQNGEFNEDSLSFEEDELESTVDFLGANITQVGLGSGMDFPNAVGNFSVGAVGKVQLVSVFGEVVNVNDDIDAGFVQENTENYVTGNVDLGIAQTFPNITVGTFGVGAVVKDVIPQSFESGDGREIHIDPKVRAGVSHQTPFTLITMDVDLTENDPVGFGTPSRYLGFGMEFNAWRLASIRGGYRTNLAVEDANIITAGVGLTPWIMNLEVSGWVKPNPEDEIDLALNSGFSADLAIKF